MDLLNIRKRVALLLETDPKSRDSDNWLIAQIWEQDIVDKDIYSYGDFYNLLIDNELTCTESITRMRRKLQEKYPNLRGTLWEKRHAEEFHVMQQLDLFDDNE